MREIKFRAWDVDDGCWASLFDGVDPSDGRPFYVDPDGVREFQVCENYTVMQFTGLKDKNGVEIYEGDIVSAPFDEWSVPVVFRSARYELDGPSYVNQSNFQENPHVYRVIGNIYENPELLESQP